MLPSLCAILVAKLSYMHVTWVPIEDLGDPHSLGFVGTTLEPPSQGGIVGGHVMSLDAIGLIPLTPL